MQKGLRRLKLTIPLLVLDSTGKQIPNFKVVLQIDIAPTIIDRLGLPIPHSWDGVSLYRQPSARFSYHQIAQYLWRYRFHGDPTLKYTFDAEHGTENLYNRSSDPAEKEYLIHTTESEALEELRAAKSSFQTERHRH